MAASVPHPPSCHDSSIHLQAQNTLLADEFWVLGHAVMIMLMMTLNQYHDDEVVIQKEPGIRILNSPNPPVPNLGAIVPFSVAKKRWSVVAGWKLSMKLLQSCTSGECPAMLASSSKPQGSILFIQEKNCTSCSDARAFSPLQALTMMARQNFF